LDKDERTRNSGGENELLILESAARSLSSLLMHFLFAFFVAIDRGNALYREEGIAAVEVTKGLSWEAEKEIQGQIKEKNKNTGSE
jgi:hypothetical protein